jgi:hypothetical protein
MTRQRDLLSVYYKRLRCSLDDTRLLYVLVEATSASGRERHVLLRGTLEPPLLFREPAALRRSSYRPSCTPKNQNTTSNDHERMTANPELSKLSQRSL